MSPSHDLAGPLLSAYLDGELDLDGRRLVESHLATCADCRQELAGLRAADVALSSLPAGPPAPDMRNEIQSRLRRRAAVGGLQGGMGLLYVITVRGLLPNLLLMRHKEYPLWFRLTRLLGFGLLLFSLTNLIAEILRDVRNLQEYAWLSGKTPPKDRSHHG
jgi:anti-sigma factor RsiW